MDKRRWYSMTVPALLIIGGVIFFCSCSCQHDLSSKTEVYNPDRYATAATNYLPLFPGLLEKWAWKYPEASLREGLDLLVDEDPLGLAESAGTNGVKVMVVCRGSQPWPFLRSITAALGGRVKVIPFCPTVLHQWNRGITGPYVDRLAAEIRKPWDVIIVDGTIHQLPAFILLDIIRRVGEGGGLILTCGAIENPSSLELSLSPFEPDARSCKHQKIEVQVTTEGEKHPITANFVPEILNSTVSIAEAKPRTGAKVLLATGSKPLLAITEFGKGRVAAFTWDIEAEGGWLLPVASLEGNKRHEGMMLLARTISWVGGNDKQREISFSEKPVKPCAVSPDQDGFILTATRPNWRQYLPEGINPLLRFGFSAELNSIQAIAGVAPQYQTAKVLCSWTNSQEQTAVRCVCLTEQAWSGAFAFHSEYYWPLLNSSEPCVVLLNHDHYEPWCFAVLPWWCALQGAKAFYVPVNPGLIRPDGTPGKYGRLFTDSTTELVGALGLALGHSRPLTDAVLVMAPGSKVGFQPNPKGELPLSLTPDEIRLACDWYVRVLGRLGYGVNLIAGEAMNQKLSAGAKAVVLPACGSLSPGSIEALKQFVECGGVVIVDAGFLAEQPHEFQSLTGMTRSENRLVRANSTGRIGPLMQACVKRAAGNSVLLLPPAWETGLQTTANVKVSALFSEGAPALVCYAHGKGKVWFLNAACGAESPLVDWGGPSMIEYILKESGCNPSMTVKGAYEDLKKVDIVCRSTAGGELIGAVCLPGDEVDFAPIRKPIEIILRERSHGYDSLRGRYLGLVDHFSLDLTSRPVALMTVVPWKLIQLKATGALRGDQLRLAVDWKTEGKKPETFYLSLQYKHNDDWVTMKRWISNGSHFETSLSGVDAGQEFRVIDGVAGIKAPVIIAGE